MRLAFRLNIGNQYDTRHFAGSSTTRSKPDEPPDGHSHGQPEKMPEFEMAITRIALIATAASLALTSEWASFRACLSSIIANGDGAAQNRVAYLLRNLR